jgi:hypothetical protein
MPASPSKSLIRSAKVTCPLAPRTGFGVRPTLAVEHVKKAPESSSSGRAGHATGLTNFLAANPTINLDIPVINKFTPTSVPIAHTELDGQ